MKIEMNIKCDRVEKPRIGIRTWTIGEWVLLVEAKDVARWKADVQLWAAGDMWDVGIRVDPLAVEDLGSFPEEVRVQSNDLLWILLKMARDKKWVVPIHAVDLPTI